MMRIILFVIVVISTTLIGLKSSYNLLFRVKELQDIRLAMQMMETEMSYGQSPLWQVFKEISARINGNIGGIFGLASEKLLDHQADYGEIALIDSILAYENVLSLTDDDCKVLFNFAKDMGLSDTDDQVKRLVLFQKKIDEQILTAKEIYDKWHNIYSVGGFSVGFIIGLFLI